MKSYLCLITQRQPPPEPKGDIRQLWDVLQVSVNDREITWDTYNPYPRLVAVPPEFVFVGAGSGTRVPFNPTSAITSGLQQLLLVFPGALRPQIGSGLTFTPLLRAGTETGVVAFDDILLRSFFGPSGLNPNRRLRPTREAASRSSHRRRLRRPSRACPSCTRPGLRRSPRWR